VGSQRTRKTVPGDPDKVSNTTLLSVESRAGKAVVRQRYEMMTVRAAADGAKPTKPALSIASNEAEL
jgi:hypothetical protein